MTCLKYITSMLVLVSAASCGGGDDAARQGDVLVTVGKQSLTAADVAARVPYGLSEEDSVKFCKAYIRQWIDGKMIGEIASRNISDMERIDKLVDDYRNNLIMLEYKRRMYEEHGNSAISNDTLMAYYNSHKSDFILKKPVVKGIFLKLPQDAPRLNQVRAWYRSDDIDDLERLEKYTLQESVNYDYFRDRWLTWDQIQSRIPMDFGGTPDMFLKNNDRFEMTDGGYVYLLSVSEYIPSGADAPYELVKDAIKDLYINENRVDYDRQLRKSLFDRGVESGEIKLNVELDY